MTIGYEASQTRRTKMDGLGDRPMPGPIARLATFNDARACLINLRNVTRLTQVEGGTEIAFVGFEFDRSGVGANPARVVVREPPEIIIENRPVGPFVPVTLARSRSAVFINLSNVSDIRASGAWTQVSFTAFGLDSNGRLVGDEIVVLEPPEEILRSAPSAW
jgi:hypothetical protein